MRQASTFALLLTAAITTFASCTDDDRGHVAVEAHGCGEVHDCDIADGTCQKAVLAVTACVRGDEAPAVPPIRTISRSQLRDELREQNSSMLDGADETQLSAVESLDTALGALHLISTQSSLGDAAADTQADSIAAFYRQDKKDVTVISDTTMDEATAMNELAHEFTHYLQDRAGQLEQALDSEDRSLDERIARRALVEGEAVVTSYRSTAQMMGLHASDIRWTTLFDMIESSIARSTNASSSPFLTATSGLQYVLATRTIESTWEQSARAGVDALFDQLPRSQLDWLTKSAGTGSSNVQELVCNPPLPPEGFDLVGVDALGLAGLYALYGTQAGASLSAAGVWRQDLLAIYRAHAAADSGEPAVLAVWRIRLQDQDAVSRVKTRLAPLDLLVTSDKQELTISVSSDAKQAPLGGSALSACPTHEQLAAELPAPSGMQASWRSPHAAGRWFDRELLAP